MAASREVTDRKTAISADVEPTRLWSKKTVAWDIAFLPDGLLVVLFPGGICVLDDTGRRVGHYLLGAVKTHNGGFFASMSTNRKMPYKMALVETRGPLGLQCAHVYTADGDTWRYDRYEVCERPWLVLMTDCGGFVIYSVKREVFKYNAKGEQQWHIEVPDTVIGASVDDTDQLFLCSGYDIFVYDRNGSLLQRVPSAQPIYCLCGTDSGQMLAASSLKRDEVCSWTDRCARISVYNSLSPVHLMYIYGYHTPEKIAAYKNHRLAIWGNHQLVVYKLN